MKKIYVFGSLIMDHTTYCEYLPKDGKSVFGNGFNISYGGKGINQAMMIKRLGGDVEMIGALGNDNHGESFLRLLKESNMSCDKIFIKDGTTGCSNIIIDKNGQNRIIVVLGANNFLTSKDILSIESDILENSIFLIQNEIPSDTIKTIIDLGKQKNALIVLNPAPYKEIDLETLNKVDILTPNENEAADLFSLTRYDEKEIVSKFDGLGCKTLIVTLGDKGAMVYDHNEIFMIKPYKVNVIDTVGAGDAFNGGLVYGLSMDLDIKASLKIANACGALTIQRKGALISQPSKAELETFLTKN